MISTSNHVSGDAVRGLVQDLITRHGIVNIQRHHLAQLALSEAARLSWQTDYPLLVFPLLAEEKVRETMACESLYAEYVSA